MKKTSLALLPFLIILLTTPVFGEEAKKAEPAKKEVKLTRVQELEKELEGFQNQYNRLIQIKGQLELQIAQTSGKLQEAKLNEQTTLAPKLEKEGIIPPKKEEKK